MKGVGIVTGLLLACFGMSIFGQHNTGAVVLGTVTDGVGAVVPDALVVATHKSGQRFEIKSGSDGRYKLRTSSGGIYKIEVILKPYKVFLIDKYQLIEGGKLNLDVSLICEDCEKLSLPASRTKVRSNFESS